MSEISLKLGTIIDLQLLGPRPRPDEGRAGVKHFFCAVTSSIVLRENAFFPHKSEISSNIVADFAATRASMDSHVGSQIKCC